MFRFTDRKSGKYLLSPTHEEEITSLVGNIVQSYKELPLKLYQICQLSFQLVKFVEETDLLARKYRDEPRPRQGLLRTREFVMKDLYTFDVDQKKALETYATVRQAYTAFFDELKIRYLAAEASSGEIGGELSHEYHIASSKGEDNIVSCDTCGYVANEERAKSKSNLTLWQAEETTNLPCKSWIGLTKDHSVLFLATFPSKVATREGSTESWRDATFNANSLRSLYPDLDMSVEDPLAEFEDTPKSQRRLLKIYDKRLGSSTQQQKASDSFLHDKIKIKYHDIWAKAEGNLQVSDADLIKIGTGDACAKCENGTLKVQTAIELGHTFHLGTRYSEPLSATVTAPPSPENNVSSNESNRESSPTSLPSDQIPLQMGCHGIGVSRLIGAIADSLSDSKGLNWPTVMAPFHAVIIPTKNQEADAASIYDTLTSRYTTNKNHNDDDAAAAPAADDEDHNLEIDTILDDRAKDFGWKLRDADMIGYPVIVVVGRDWKREGKVEVQCRRLGVKEGVKAGGLRRFVQGLLRQL